MVFLFLMQGLQPAQLPVEAIVLPNGPLPLGDPIGIAAVNNADGAIGAHDNQLQLVLQHAPPASGAFAAPPNGPLPAGAPAPAMVPANGGAAVMAVAQQPLSHPVMHPVPNQVVNGQDAAALGQVVAMAFQQGVAAAAQQVPTHPAPPPAPAPAAGQDAAGLAQMLAQQQQTLSAIQTSITRREISAPHRSTGTHAGTAAAAALFVRSAVASQGEHGGDNAVAWVRDLDDYIESGEAIEKAVKAFEHKVVRGLPDCEREGRRLALCVLMDSKSKRHRDGKEDKDRSTLKCRACQGIGHFARDCPSKPARYQFAPQSTPPVQMAPSMGAYTPQTPSPYVANPSGFYSKFCDYCHRYGHRRETCYMLIGRPGGTP